MKEKTNFSTATNGRYPGEGIRYQVGDGVARAALVQPYVLTADDPPVRPLQIYTLDPAASRREGSVTTVKVPYEKLAPGPVGALFTVDCRDRDSQHTATPANLDDPRTLINNGCQPSSINLHFHQQMVYAVCMNTYASFRKALGREVAWGFGGSAGQQRQPRLRIFPFGFEGKNAYYDRHHGELRFGYYRATKIVGGRNLPNGRVYTCLSHDIIVHEMTHALLDGLRRRFDWPATPCVPAFHEAFADLIAIFQRFSHEQIVRAAIRQAYQNGGNDVPLLTQIARQFGQTTTDTENARLRNFDMQTVLRKPKRYDEVDQDPHSLSSILVAAVLNAAVAIFLDKTQRYVRLATGGTGSLSKGALPIDLEDLLVKNVQELAKQFLSICVRAIDYCPPVDVDFGDFLRAVITVDHDLVPDDPWGYREAWIDAFRVRAIYPTNVETLAEESLRWSPPQRAIPPIKALDFAHLRFDGEPGRPASPDELHRQACALGQVVAQPQWIEEFGCALPGDVRLRGDVVDPPTIESIRSCQRTGPDGQIAYDLVAEVLQRRRVQQTPTHPAFDFFGGATVILDPHGRIRYIIRKRIVSENRVAQQREFLQSEDAQRYWKVEENVWTLQNPDIKHMFEAT